MASTIQIKRGTECSSTLKQGELGYDLNKDILYIGNNENKIIGGPGYYEGPITKTGSIISEEKIKGERGISVISDLKPLQSGSGNPYLAGGGENLLNYDKWKYVGLQRGTAVFENNGVTLTATEDDCYTNDGLDFEDAENTYLAPIPISVGESITLSWEADRTYSANIYIFPNAQLEGLVVCNNNENRPLTYTATEGITFVTIRFSATKAGDTISYRNIMVNKGTTALPFEPYSNIRSITAQSTTSITRCGKNLASNIASNNTLNGITIQKNGSSEIIVYGTATNTFGFLGFETYLPTGTYTYSIGDIGNITRLEITINDIPYAHLFSNENKTFTINNPSTVKLNFIFYNGVNCGTEDNPTRVKVQLELGTAATAYESYRGSTFSLDFGQTICGGKLDWNTGILTVDRALIVFTGNEDIGQQDDYGSFYTPKWLLGAGESICSHAFAADGNNWNLSGGIAFIVGLNRIIFSNSYFGVNSRDEFVSYLAAQYAAGTPVQIAYKLATPRVIQLSPQQIVSLIGNNTLYGNKGEELTVIFNHDTPSNTHIGARNLLERTNQGIEYWGWSTQTGQKTIEVVEEDETKCILFTRTQEEQTGWSVIHFIERTVGQLMKKLKENTEYVLSVEIKPGIDSEITLQGILTVDATNTLAYADSRNHQLVSGKWNRCVWLLKTIEDFSSLDPLKHQTIYFTPGHSNIGMTYMFKNLKLERGNKATDWTPAPEDANFLSEAINFANNTWNPVGDDVAIGDCNSEGLLGIKGLNGATGLNFYPYEGSIGQTITINGAGIMNISGTVASNFMGNLNGNASTATALTTSAGQDRVPVYFSEGKPIQIKNLWLDTRSALADEVQIGIESAKGTIYLYASDTYSRGLYGFNSNGEGINILRVSDSNEVTLNGNAATASKLATARHIFGKSFDGTADVLGKGIFYGYYNSSVNERFYSSAIEIRENDMIGGSQEDIGYAPSLAFHWSMKAAGTLALGADTKFRFLTQSGNTATVIANIEGNASSANKVNSVLTIQGNGTNLNSFDGSSAKTINITPENIHALSVGGGTLYGALLFDNAVTNARFPSHYYHNLYDNTNCVYLHFYPTADIIATQATSAELRVSAGNNSFSHLRLEGEEGKLLWNYQPVLYTGNYYNYAVPLTGGTMSGSLSVKRDDDQWISVHTARTLNGTLHEANVYVDQNSAVFSFLKNGEWTNGLVLYDNSTFLSKPLMVEAGGTGTSDPATARANLGITPGNIGALPITGGTVTGSLRVNTSSTSSGGVLINEDGEGGTIVITSKSGTYNYEIDAVGDDWIRMHNASTHPNSYKTIWWSASSGNLHTDSLSLSSALAINYGGTGANNALDALKNLGMVVNGVDIQANDAASWEQQAKAYIVEKLQNNRVTMFDLGWQGRSYGAGIAWKSTGKIHAIIHNNSGTGGVKIWEYFISGGNWNDIPLNVSSGGTGATTAAGARSALGITPANIGALATYGGTLTGSLEAKINGTSIAEFRATNNNGSVTLCSDNGRGIWDYTGNKWVIFANVGSNDWNANFAKININNTTDITGITYSSSEPARATGRIWLKPI